MATAPATKPTRPEFFITKSLVAAEDLVGAAAPPEPLAPPLTGAVILGFGKACAPLGIGLGRWEAEAP
jgi:hypothetical protein